MGLQKGKSFLLDVLVVGERVSVVDLLVKVKSVNKHT